MVLNTNPLDRPDGTATIVGSQGAVVTQDSSTDKQVVVPGATKANRDFDVEGHDLIGTGDYDTGVLDVSGAASINVSIESQETNAFEVKFELYATDEVTLLRTIDQDDFATLNSGNDGVANISYPVYGDHIKVVITDLSGGPNTIDGSINFHTGPPGVFSIVGSDGADVDTKQLQNSPSGTTSGMVTVLAAALNDVALDELVSRITDSTGTQIDPRTDDFAAANFVGQDINAATQTIDFTGADGTVPDRADTISVTANPTGDAHAEVIFYDDAAKSNTLATITDTENSDLGSTGGGLITAEVAIFTPHIDVDFVDDSAAANSTDGAAYAR